MGTVREEWIDAETASEILTSNSGHQVSREYPRRLAFLGLIEVWHVNKKALLFKRASVESYRVKERSQKQVNKDAEKSAV